MTPRASVDALRDQVIGQTDDLVRQETVGSSDDPTSAGLGREAPSDLGSAVVDRGAQEHGRLGLEVLGCKPLQLIGQLPAIDDRAPVGDQLVAWRLSHPSAAIRFNA